MGHFKQMSIDLGIPEEDFRDLMIYIINDRKVTREIFIKELSYALYNDSKIDDFRKTIDCVLSDCNSEELLCLGNKKFFTYIPDISKEVEEHPLKLYEVSYELRIEPLFKGASKRVSWKHVTEIVEAHRFRDAKDIVRERLNKEARTFKNMRVVEKLLEKPNENVHEQNE